MLWLSCVASLTVIVRCTKAPPTTTLIYAVAAPMEFSLLVITGKAKNALKIVHAFGIERAVMPQKKSHTTQRGFR